MSSQRVSGTAVQRTIAVLGSAVFFVVATCTLAGLVPWSITGWQLRPPFLGLELTRGIGAIMIRVRLFYVDARAREFAIISPRAAQDRSPYDVTLVRAA